MGNLNAAKVLENIDKCLNELDTIPYSWNERRNGKKFNIKSVYKELSIFDWWNDTLSKSQLKQMKSFVQTAIKLGFTGYVCFKVGAAGCSHGMWAHTNESTTGYSPDDGDVLFHSFRSGDNYYSAEIDGKWLGEWFGNEEECKFTLGQVKDILSHR